MPPCSAIHYPVTDANVVYEADVLRDEGEAYAAKLRAVGVPVTSVRYLGIVHDFVMLHSLKDTAAQDSYGPGRRPSARHTVG